jgi:hypothetical protein
MCSLAKIDFWKRVKIRPVLKLLDALLLFVVCRHGFESCPSDASRLFIFTHSYLKIISQLAWAFYLR